MDAKKIKKYVRNRELGGTYCEQVIGSSVGKMASLWKKYADDLLFIEEIMTHEYVVNQGESKEKTDIFKLGVRAINEFLNECFEEKIDKVAPETKSTNKQY